MKVALIVPGGFDPGERVIPALNDLAAQLATRHDVCVFAAGGPSGPARYVRDGYAVQQLAESPSTGAQAAPILPGRAGRAALRGQAIARLTAALARSARERAFDRLHAFWAGDAAFASAAIGRALRVPVIVSIGGGEAVWIPEASYGGARSATARAELDLTLGLARAVTAGSAFAAEVLPPHARARAQVVPLGVRTASFEMPIDRPPGPPWRLLHVGDVNLVKRQDMLLATLALIRARGIDATLDIAGEDTRRGALQRTAEDLGIARHVAFHGFVRHAQLADRFRRAHLHVLSSRYESQGVSILEAAAAGLPTVGTPVGLLPTLAPGAARCVPHGDPVAFADAIMDLLADAGARHRMGAAARAWATAHDAVWTAARFASIYDAVSG